MKTLLIDTDNKIIKEVVLESDGENYDDYSHAICKAIGCIYFAHALTFPNGDMLYINEDGLKDDSKLAFVLDGASLPIFGNALIVGEGTLIPQERHYQSDLLEITPEVRFCNAVETKKIRDTLRKGTYVIDYTHPTKTSLN